MRVCVFTGAKRLLVVPAVLIGAGVVAWILAGGARVGYPSDLNALKRALEREFGDVYVDRMGDLMLVKGKALFFTISARVDCASGRHSLSRPWAIPPRPPLHPRAGLIRPPSAPLARRQGRCL
ncbi:MAG: hypothetical protein ABWJ97_03715 [Thermoproteus sp.]